MKIISIPTDTVSSAAPANLSARGGAKSTRMDAGTARAGWPLPRTSLAVVRTAHFSRRKARQAKRPPHRGPSLNAAFQAAMERGVEPIA